MDDLAQRVARDAGFKHGDRFNLRHDCRQTDLFALLLDDGFGAELRVFVAPHALFHQRIDFLARHHAFADELAGV